MNKGLNSEEMELVGTLFQESINFLLQNATEKAMANISGFMTDRVINDIAPVMMSVGGLKKLRHETFSNMEVREFIQKLCFTFFSRWADSEDKIIALCHNLSRGLTQTPYDDPKFVSGVPKEYTERLPTRTDAYEALVANPWLMVIIMMPLFMSSKSFPQAPAQASTALKTASLTAIGPTPL